MASGLIEYEKKIHRFPMLDIGFLFTNSGAKSGLVRNIKILLKNNDFIHTFYPMSEINKLTTYKREQIDEMKANQIDNIGSFFLPRYSELKKAYAFVPISRTTLYLDDSDSSMLPQALPAGKYNLQLYVLIDQKNDWTKLGEFTFTLNGNFSVEGRRELYFDKFLNELTEMP